MFNTYVFFATLILMAIACCIVLAVFTAIFHSWMPVRIAAVIIAILALATFAAVAAGI